MARGKYEEWLTEDKLILIEGWARNGLTDEQIAHNMGVAYKTLKEWKKKYSAICAALKKGKEVVDLMVENALFKSAMGYDIEEWEEKLDAAGRVHKLYKKRHIPPSNTAQIFWLKNRKPEQWRDKPVEKPEKMEDDGLIDALKDSTDIMQDDSAMLPEEEENSNDTE